MTSFETPSRWRNARRWKETFVFSDYTTLSEDRLVIGYTEFSDVTITLPPASAVPGTILSIKKVHQDNFLYITPVAGDLIDLVPTLRLGDDQDSFTLQSSTDGANWYVTSGTSYAPPQVVVTAVNYSPTTKDDIIVCNPLTDITITLPDAADAPGKIFSIKKLSTAADGSVTVVTASAEQFDFLFTSDVLTTIRSASMYSSLSAPGSGYVRVANYGLELMTQTCGGAETSGNNQTEIEMLLGGVSVANGYASLPFDCQLLSMSITALYDDAGGDPGDWTFAWTVYDSAGGVVHTGSIPVAMDNPIPGINLSQWEGPVGAPILQAGVNHWGATFTGPGVTDVGCSATLVFSRL